MVPFIKPRSSGIIVKQWKNLDLEASRGFSHERGKADFRMTGNL
jgi:hypothetical protein